MRYAWQIIDIGKSYLSPTTIMLQPHIYAPSCTCGKIECSVQVSKNSASLAFTPDAASGRLLSFAKIIAAVPFRQAHRAPKCSAIIVFSSYIFPLKTELPPKGVDCNSLAIQSYVEIKFGNQHKTFWVIESQILRSVSHLLSLRAGLLCKMF